MPPRSVKRSTRSHLQTPAPLGEAFDLNVSSSEDDDDVPAAQPAPTNAQPVAPVDVGINNTDVREGKNYAADIRHFFEATPTEKICKVCRYVFLLLILCRMLMLFTAKLKKRRATLFHRVLGTSTAPRHQIPRCARI